MARGQKASKFARFGRGLNTADGVFGLREGYEDDPQGKGSEARALLNVVSKHRGNVSRRNGCAELYADADSLVFKDLSIIGNGSSSFVVCSSTAGGLYAIDERPTRRPSSSPRAWTPPHRGRSCGCRRSARRVRRSA